MQRSWVQFTNLGSGGSQSSILVMWTYHTQNALMNTNKITVKLSSFKNNGHVGNTKPILDTGWNDGCLETWLYLLYVSEIISINMFLKLSSNYFLLLPTKFWDSGNQEYAPYLVQVFPTYLYVHIITYKRIKEHCGCVKLLTGQQEHVSCFIAVLHESYVSQDIYLNIY